MNYNYSTPINELNESVAEKLEKIAGNAVEYNRLLKYQGRLYKHPVIVALSFSAQHEEADYVGTIKQWEAAKYKVKQGEKGLHIVQNGVERDYYTLAQTESGSKPPVWVMDSKHAALVKNELGIAENKSLIMHLAVESMDSNRITECMRALNIPTSKRQEFGKALRAATAAIIAGRFEVDAERLSVRTGIEEFKGLGSNTARLTFLNAASISAREALLRVEAIIKNDKFKERNERNDLREVAGNDRGTAELGSGGRTAGNTGSAADERYNISESVKAERSDGLGNSSGDSGENGENVVPGILSGAEERQDVLVQIRSDNGTVQHEPDRSRTLDGERTDRDLWSEVDGLHGEELSSSGSGDADVQQVSDNSEIGGQIGTGVQRTAGQSVRAAEPSSNGVSGSAGMGESKNVLYGQHSDEGESAGSGDKTVTGDSISFSESVEVDINNDPSTNSADGFVVNEDTYQRELEEIVNKITRKKKELAENIGDMTADDIRSFSEELSELEKQREDLKNRINKLPISLTDIENLRAIEPKRKSVQNLLETEIAQVPKFEAQQAEKMGEKSAFVMRQEGGNDWRDDDSKLVPIINIKVADKPEKLTDVRKDKTIERGTYVNNDTGSAIIFGKRCIEETVAKAIQDNRRGRDVDVRMELLYNMRKLIENAICFDTVISEVGASKTQNTLFMHHFYLPVKSGDDYYLAKLYVEETLFSDKDNKNDTSKRVYNAKDIKITPIEANRVFSPTSAITKGDNADTSIGAIISISHLYQIVKIYDSNFFENEKAIGRKERLEEIAVERTVEAALEKVDTYINFSDLVNIDKLNRNGDIVYWDFFNEDGNYGKGQMVEITITHEDIAAAVSAMNSAGGGNEQGYQAFIDNITENCSQTLTDGDTEDFESEKEHFLNGKYDLTVTSSERSERNREIADFIIGSDPHFRKFSNDDVPPVNDNSGDYSNKENGAPDNGEQLSFDMLPAEQNDLSEKKEDSMDRAMRLIKEFCESEYDSAANFSNPDHVDIAYTTDEETELAIEVYADLETFRIVKEYDHTVVKEELYNSLEDMCDNGLEGMKFDELVSLSDDEKQIAAKHQSEKVDTYINFETEQPAEKRHRKTMSEKLYDKFEQLFPDIVSGEHEYERYGELGDSYEPLSVEALGGDTYAFMTYYEQLGDIMRDPDFSFRIDREQKTLTILEYQQDGVPGIGSVYQNVFDENGSADEKLLAALEKNFMQNLNEAERAGRELTRFRDRNGDYTEISVNPKKQNDSEETMYVSKPENNDKTPELRAVLNEFSRKHGLGELNVTPGEHSFWQLKEKMRDGTETKLGTLYNIEYDMPFNPQTLEKALISFEEENKRYKRDMATIGRREFDLRVHGGMSELPEVQKDLPEIKYADKPSQKIRDNITAIREVLRLEKAESSGKALYDERGKYADTRENSDERLRRYSGWGGLSQVFDERFPQQQRNRDVLHSMLTDEEYSNARASSLNAHYTPQIVIDAMYKVIKNMDLPRNARILEPACGSGNFITRLPGSFSDAEIVGVELDGITAKIAKWLNHDDRNVRIINSAFERSGLNNDSFDLAIGNVPFGDYNMNDPDHAKDWLIHDAFFRKALDKVAPGGIVAFVTSSGTMDKGSPKVREYLATMAELVGAVRLPNNTFKDAGTPVTSDIIFLKKRETPLAAHEPKPDWCYTVPNEDGLRINSYFVDNPQMVLGKMEKTTYYDRLTCAPIEGADLEKQLNEAIKNINAKITVSRRNRMMNEIRGNIEPWGKNFTFQIKDGKAYYRQGEIMTELGLSKADTEKMTMLCTLRDTTRELLEKQKTSVSDDELLPLRKQLNEHYDSYKSKYGTLSEKSVSKLFGNDSDYPIIKSLEQVNGEKADIFFRRTVNPEIEITNVETAEQALQISLDRKGKVDVIYMSMLLENSESESEINEIAEKVCSELLEKGLIYIDPEKQMPDVPYSGIVERSEYLSGNVRMKLTLANEYAKSDKRFERNIAALEKVVPEDIRAEEISVQMGCTWIDPQDYTEFLVHLSGRTKANTRNCDVSYSPLSGEFSVMNAGSKKDLNVNETTTYGTKDLNMYQLAEKVLNQRRIAVMQEVPSKKDPTKVVTRTDPRATKIALEKAKKIKEEFRQWIFDDQYRKEKYERRYNDIFNSLVGREYDGSRLSFPGLKNDFALRPHQKNCVARAISGNALAAHVVGAGKSAVMFSTVMKKKELGLINKACVVVPKPLTEQVANEWRTLYPNAKILTVTNDDLSSEKKRNLFTARVAAGSYDAVILSQEQYEKIPMSKEYRIQFMQQELDKLEDMLREKKIEGKGKRDYSVKAIEKAKAKLKTKIEKLTDPKGASKAKDDLLEFEQLGFDYLVVDEAHAYKNGFVTTKMTNVAGVTTRPSGRAEDMQMKTDYFNEKMGQGHILFCTGTPVSNSMTELYVMTRYLRPDLLEQAGVSRFDDWAATFGNVVTKNQQAADGTLKLRTSFASFANLPELMAIYKEFADVQSADKLNLPRPTLKTGKPQIVKAPATPEQKAYVKDLAARAERIANGEVEPYEDNLLKITGEARLIGLGNRAIEALYKKRGEELPDDFVSTEESKVDMCIYKVAELYKQTEKEKGVQIIFSDIAVNSDNGNFSVYDYIKQQLNEKYGIPENEIIFAPKSDSKERENIFKAINEGKYRVVIASTNTLGTGANIQEHLYALHHIDVPWKPSDFEQREGRILRQGNSFKEVEIFNYVTEGTLDSYLYQTVTDKARFIAQLLDDKCPARVSEDCDEKVLTFGEIQAAAEGNPDFKRRIELSNEIAELTMLKNEYQHETAVTRMNAERLPEYIEQKKAVFEKVKADITNAASIKELVITRENGSKVTERKSINAILLALAKAKTDIENTDKTELNICGFRVSAYNNGGESVCFSIKGNSAYSFEAGTHENQDNYQRIMNFITNLPHQEEQLKADIASMETDLEQAKKRVAEPFSQEAELAAKEKELSELERKLSGLSAQTDDIIDASEEPYEETKEENKARKEFYNSDDDDYQPTDNNGYIPPANGR